MISLRRQSTSQMAIYRWWRSHPKQVFALDEVEPKFESLYLWCDRSLPLTHDELMKAREWSSIFKLGETLMTRLLAIRTEWSRK